MTPIMFEAPALLTAAGGMSATAQRKYLNLLKSEYLVLIAAAVLSLDLSESRVYYINYALVFAGGLIIMLFRSISKPEQDWYKGRALAESIKTTTWRYCMRAAPFDDAANLSLVKAEFRNYLKKVLESNRHIGDKVPANSAANDQITDTMEATRALPLVERKEFYLNFRIKEQRVWYQSKAVSNKRFSTIWLSISVAVYSLAFVSVLLRMSYPTIKLWPTEVLTVSASSIIGWIQTRRFNELAASYTLTAHEIGILQSLIIEINGEPDFSQFVNDAELAFSREHTQWVARQQT